MKLFETVSLLSIQFRKKHRLLPVLFSVLGGVRTPVGSTPARRQACRSATALRAALGAETSPPGHHISTMVLIQNHRAFSILVDVYTAI